ncbi:MAG: SLBB domain-containing protein [Verrucomicrobia bacterium]|nr:SLBB domain-containing protein [Verrucomicrobiota bacterium]
MISQLLRTALVLTLLHSAPARLIAAEPPPTQKQVEDVRQQLNLAQLRNDQAAVARYDKDLKALEARLGLAAPPATLAPVPSFFSAPPGSTAPATSSTLFSPPTTPAAAVTPPAVLPSPSARPAPPAPAAPAPVAPSFTPATPKAATSAVAPFAGTFSPATPVRPGNTPTQFAEEPRPAELPPAVLDLRAAQSELSRLEEFRMAESQTSRRSAPTSPEPPRSSFVPPPSAVIAPSSPASPFTFAPTPSVNLVGGADDPRRRLEDITRRRSDLQLEAERLAKDSVDWETRYNAAKAELARIETENKGRGRLETIREEISRLDSDATRLMQEIEAGRADQGRRAREIISVATPSPSLTSLVLDRPTVPALGTTAPAAAPERKGPQFLPVGSLRPTPQAAGDGNIVRTGRSGGDPVAIQRELERLNEKRELVLRELEEVQVKFNVAQRELAMAGRTGVQADLDRWTRETASLDARYKSAAAELAKIDADQQGRIAALKGAMGSDDPDVVNPGDVLRLVVAEDDSYTANYPVKRDGSIAVKNVGKMAAGGKQISEVEAAIKAALEENQLTKATVTLEFVTRANQGSSGLPATDQTLIIYLAGEFITPGPLKIPEGVTPTLITTIIRSGGVTPSGDLTRAKLLRIENGQGAVEEVNVAAILSGNIPPADIALNAGDIIMIPAFAPVVYVTGNVNKPGTLRLFQDETLTAYSAILRAGGFARFANLKKCTVVRDLGNGEKMQMPLNVKEIQKGLAPDIVLQGKDIVVIPESFFSF